MDKSIFDLVVGIIVDDSGLDKGIDEAEDKVTKSTGKLGKVMGKLGGVAAVAGKVAMAGISAAATGISAVATQSMSSVADYEQLVGGVETLFKDSSDKVMEYANKAYQTAGLSANNYMETVTSFSASLLQSLGGDTELAADVANRAIVDMSDNANKMGSSMESLQNAYNGFAKQNYTMLDNLKLGYGGTKEEMSRLIEEASHMTEEMEELGVTVDGTDMSFGNIVNAISVVQKHLEITGTTSIEASETISGSLASMKSAWENLLTGVSDPDQDLTVLVDNLVDSVVTVADNLVPRLEIILPRIADGLTQVIEKLIPYIPPIIESLLPALVDGSVALVQALVDSLPSIIDLLIAATPLFVVGAIQIVAGVVARLPEIIEQLILAIPDIVIAIGKAFQDAFPDAYIYIEAAFMMILDLVEAIWDDITTEISNRIDEAKNIIANGIAFIKDLFNFEWKFPDLKLPHFKIDGAFSLTPPSVPHIGVDWYAKAMDNPMIMTSPTVFGISKAGNLMAGGDAGSEVVSGTDTLMGMIGNAVAGNQMDKNMLVSAIVEALAQVTLNMNADLSANDNKLFDAMRVRNAEFRKMNGASAF